MIYREVLFQNNIKLLKVSTQITNTKNTKVNSRLKRFKEFTSLLTYVVRVLQVTVQGIKILNGMVLGFLFTPVSFLLMEVATCAVSMYIAVSWQFQFMRCNSIHAFINTQAVMEVPVRDFMTYKNLKWYYDENRVFPI